MNTLPTNSSDNYQSDPVPDTVISNGTEGEPEAKVSKPEGIVIL